MAFVNSNQKTECVKTCKDLADVFLANLVQASHGYNEVRLVFDRYMQGSLKEQMREKHTGGNEIQYHVDDRTVLTHIPLEQFLSHIQTKAELTTYLADKCLVYFSQHTETNFVVVSGTTAQSNHDRLAPNLCEHRHEVADTLLILHATDANKNSSVKQLDVCSPDTDVLLLLLYWYTHLCTKTRFLTGKGSAKALDHSETTVYCSWCGKGKCTSGFRAFTGTDTTGLFSGKTKALCFKTFLSCESHVLQAFGKLGKKTDLPCDETAEALESFVGKLYSPRQKHTNTAELRWYLFSQKHAEGEKLPPTRATLRPHICRVHYVTMTWVHADDPLP